MENFSRDVNNMGKTTKSDANGQFSNNKIFIQTDTYSHKLASKNPVIFNNNNNKLKMATDDKNSDESDDQQENNNLTNIHHKIEENLQSEIIRLESLLRAKNNEQSRVDDQIAKSNSLVKKLEEEKQNFVFEFLEQKNQFEKISNDNKNLQSKLKEKEIKIHEIEELLVQNDKKFRHEINSLTTNHLSKQVIFDQYSQNTEKLLKKIDKKKAEIMKLKKEGIMFLEKETFYQSEIEMLKKQLSDLNNLRRKGIDGFQAECSENFSLREKLYY